ncbi:MAG: RDD family protein [Bacillota bacterium]|nr:RDD family protein [Bacillota bacterium]
MTDPVTGLPLAGFWRRAGGYLIDGVLVFAISLGVRLLLGRAAGFLDSLISVAYWVAFIGARGATPGMRAVGARVVRAEDGRVPTWADAVIRWLGMALCAVTLGVGYLWVAWDGRKQGLHDHIARTLVVMDA